MKPFKAFPSHQPTPNGLSMPKAENDENESLAAELQEVLEWATGDLLKHITEGTGRSLLGAFIRERVSRLRLYTYYTLDIIYYILYLISSVLYSVQYTYMYIYIRPIPNGVRSGPPSHTHIYLYIHR